MHIACIRNYGNYRRFKETASDLQAQIISYIDMEKSLSFCLGMMDDSGIRQYTPESYGTALLLIPLSALLGAFMIVLVGVKIRQRKAVLMQNC
jgi:hypothetical protein